MTHLPDSSTSTHSESKRDFLKYVIGGGFIAWLIAILYPILAYLKSPKITGVEVRSIKVMKVDELQNNQAKIFRFGDTPAILILTKSGEFRAFKATCTHLDCTVQYREDLQMIWCACHNGKYDVSGRNVSGPPPKPLQPYTVNVKGDDVYVSKG